MDKCSCGHYWLDHTVRGCEVDVGEPWDQARCSCYLDCPPEIRQEHEDALERIGREMRLKEALEHPCPTHPKYQIKRKPRVACEPCWRLWIAVNP